MFSLRSKKDTSTFRMKKVPYLLLCWPVPIVQMTKLGILGYPQCSQWRFWPDCANAQANLSLFLAHVRGYAFQCYTSNGPRHPKTCLRAYVDSECLDQPAHPHSLIRIFTVRNQNNWIQWTLVTMAAFFPKDIAIKMNCYCKDSLMSRMIYVQQMSCFIVISS